MPTFDRITVEPGKCGGKPCIRGMRITVRRVLEIMATHRDRDAIFREYPFLEEEDLEQALPTPLPRSMRNWSTSTESREAGIAGSGPCATSGRCNSRSRLSHPAVSTDGVTLRLHRLPLK